MMPLKFYLVRREYNLYETYWAEDTEHALEQARDTDSANPIYEVYECNLVWDNSAQEDWPRNQ
jgi:hypothetical protein